MRGPDHASQGSDGSNSDGDTGKQLHGYSAGLATAPKSNGNSFADGKDGRSIASLPPIFRFGIPGYDGAGQRWN